jgi:hypothetical protein
MKDNKLDSTKNEKYFNRYLSHSSAIINDSKQQQQQQQQIYFDERERRNTYTLPRQLRPKERRLTLNSINISQQNSSNNNQIPTRDTDSSSTQDSGYSESTPFFLVQQATPDTEQPLITSKVCLNN